MKRSGLSTLSLKDTRTNEEKWIEYPEFEGDKDEEEILTYYDLHEEKWTEYLEFEGDKDEEKILAYYDLCKEKWSKYLEFEGDEDEEEIHYVMFVTNPVSLPKCINEEQLLLQT